MARKHSSKKDPTAWDAIGEADRTDRRPTEEIRLSAIAANNERAARIRAAMASKKAQE